MSIESPKRQLRYPLLTEGLTSGALKNNRSHSLKLTQIRLRYDFQIQGPVRLFDEHWP